MTFPRGLQRLSIQHNIEEMANCFMPHCTLEIAGGTKIINVHYVGKVFGPLVIAISPDAPRFPLCKKPFSMIFSYSYIIMQ